MGLFDYVRCEYPLPGNPPVCASDAEFQTKDLTCFMMHYTITADGRLKENSGTEDYSDITATIDLDWSNVVASGPGVYTRNGEDAHYLEYKVTFSNGKIVSIVETTNESERAAKHKPSQYPELSPEDRKRIDARHPESLIGRKMCVWWGGDSSKPYEVTVIAETGRDWIVRGAKERSEIISRHQRDCTFFDSEADGAAYKAERRAHWERLRKEYEEEIAR